jgi:hypothetical protein
MRSGASSRKPTQGRSKRRVLAFLFPHERTRRGELEDLLASIDLIEALTGLGFFGGVNISAEEEAAFEAENTVGNWVPFLEA